MIILIIINIVIIILGVIVGFSLFLLLHCLISHIYWKGEICKCGNKVIGKQKGKSRQWDVNFKFKCHKCGNIWMVKYDYDDVLGY